MCFKVSYSQSVIFDLPQTGFTEKEMKRSKYFETKKKKNFIDALIQLKIVFLRKVYTYFTLS